MRGDATGRERAGRRTDMITKNERAREGAGGGAGTWSSCLSNRRMQCSAAAAAADKGDQWSGERASERGLTGMPNEDDLTFKEIEIAPSLAGPPGRPSARRRAAVGLAFVWPFPLSRLLARSA